MMLRLRPARGEKGFTLVEMMASMLVFSIVTIGMVPLLASSLKGADVSRSYNIGKTAALEAMERVRGLPYFVSYPAQSRKVDVLDLYFPATSALLAGQTYDGANGIFTNVCTGSSSTNPACPRNIPVGVTLTFRARFIKPSGTATNSTDPADESYSLVTPPSDYVWNSTSGKDAPPSQFLEMTVVADWQLQGRPRTYELRSLISDRRFGIIKLEGFARIDYGVQVQTSFLDPNGIRSDLTALAGTAESRIQTRRISTAQQLLNAGQLRLVRAPVGTNLGGQDVVTPVAGAAAVHQAPPDATPPATTADRVSIIHPDLVPPVEVTALGASSASDVSVKVAGQLPAATGRFGYTDLNEVYMYVNNQAETGNTAALKLDATRPMLGMYRVGDSLRMSGTTNAVTTALDAFPRRVQTTATVSFPELRLLPTLFITVEERAVVVVDDFTASVNCDSTANGTTAVGSGSWSATLKYWQDPDENDITTDGGYKSLFLTHANFATELAKIGNPLVYDDILDELDVYLFKPGSKSGRGYLNEAIKAAAPTGTKDAKGVSTSGAVDGALRITSVPTNPTLPQTGLSVSIGKLSCQATDNR